jgi:GxxExxY protein
MPHPALPAEGQKILGACHKIYAELGSKLDQGVYHECLAMAFRDLAIPFEAQQEFQARDPDGVLRHLCQADFLCYGTVVVEVRAVAALQDDHRAELLNCLYATGRKLGILVNFGHARQLEYECFAAPAAQGG